ILLGQEKTGISEEALALADHQIIIPMVGMVQSLNVSVASALILYEAQRQRQLAGMYDSSAASRLSEEEQQRLLYEGGYPVIAKVARRKGLPMPQIDQYGEIVAPPEWWAAIQAADN
ncbi:MAG: TrmH family RNA methyltransferase, partial [Plesiomonas shigelloides]